MSQDEPDTIVEKLPGSDGSPPPSGKPARLRTPFFRATPAWLAAILLTAIIGSLIIAFSSGLWFQEHAQHRSEIDKKDAALGTLRAQTEQRGQKLVTCVEELRACSHDVFELIAVMEHNSALSAAHLTTVDELTANRDDITTLRERLKKLNETIEDAIDSMGNPRRKGRRFWKKLKSRLDKKQALSNRLKKMEAEYFLGAQHLKSSFDADSKRPSASLKSKNEAREELVDKLAAPISP